MTFFSTFCVHICAQAVGRPAPPPIWYGPLMLRPPGGRKTKEKLGKARKSKEKQATAGIHTTGGAAGACHR